MFSEGIFTPHALLDERSIDILSAATQRCSGTVRPSDILHAAIDSGDQGVLSVLSLTLAEGAQPRHLLETIAVYNPGSRDGQHFDFDGRRERFAAETLAALDRFAAEFAEDRDRLRPVCLELLVACVLEQPDPGDRQFLRILDATAAARALRDQVRVSVEPPPPLLDDTGRLRSEEFSADAWAVLEQAAERAGELGYDRLLPPHCFLALLGETEGLTERLVRLQIPPQLGLAKVAEMLSGAFRLSQHGKDAPPLHRDGLGEPLLAMLAQAQRAAAVWGAEQVDTPHLLDALLEDPPPRLASVFQTDPLRVDLARMRELLAQSVREARTAGPREVAFRLAAGSPPAEDLTWVARTQGIPPARHLERYFDALGRALHRTTDNHVLITGPAGVGSTTLLRELARRAAAGELPFLRRKRLLRVDCRDVPDTESGAKLARIIAHVAGRTDLIVCLDGLGALLRGPGDTHHVLALRSALKERRIHLVGVLSDQEYDDLLAADHVLRELTTRIPMTEPDRNSARDMVQQVADALEAEFGVGIDGRVVDRAVVMSSDFILNQRLPLAAVKVLRRACEDLDYRRTQHGETGAVVTGAGSGSVVTGSVVTTEDVVRVIAEVSGVPAEQIAGTGGERIDYEQALGGSVFGQRDAVGVVASELRRIKAGLAGASGGPASVMLFAGLTGTGKTELAKTVASFYSSSKRLVTYPMANFTEAHSVSGIIGSPPGYIGYERGGKLINELNADPYGVFLLDEAEKAHSEVWRPFLNLFDEGWIVDQRGVKAHGDRAIFILTSNAGAEIISRMTREGRPEKEIVAAVKEALLRVGDQSRGGPVFSPEFMARIDRVIVFRPLDLDAMVGICLKTVDKQRAWWLEKREKELVVPESLIDYVARRGHLANEKSGGKEGGRVIGKLLKELIDQPLLLEGERREEEFRRCGRIECVFHSSGPDGPWTEIRFRPAQEKEQGQEQEAQEKEQEAAE
ncbi:AAA family ATPase [Streptomyces tailanensis]|uniref:AAA family ATPase n=1 Tax=Streptomyces tailanensis TaxID=2569858 RepID=UPI00122E64E8|nr:AAA family ATPase [Streptomyces tailanensis]